MMENGLQKIIVEILYIISLICPLILMVDIYYVMLIIKWRLLTLFNDAVMARWLEIIATNASIPNGRAQWWYFIDPKTDELSQYINTDAQTVSSVGWFMQVTMNNGSPAMLIDVYQNTVLEDITGYTGFCCGSVCLYYKAAESFFTLYDAETKQRKTYSKVGLNLLS